MGAPEQVKVPDCLDVVGHQSGRSACPRSCPTAPTSIAAPFLQLAPPPTDGDGDGHHHLDHLKGHQHLISHKKAGFYSFLKEKIIAIDDG